MTDQAEPANDEDGTVMFTLDGVRLKPGDRVFYKTNPSTWRRAMDRVRAFFSLRPIDQGGIYVVVDNSDLER